MHRIHSGLTVAVAIEAGKKCQLEKVLRRLNNISPGKITNPAETANFKNSSTTLFVSGVILPADDYFGEPLPETFVFATSYWGPLSNHLTDLIRTNRIHLTDIFQCCADFPPGDAIHDVLLANYLLKHSYPSTFTSRYNCFTKKEVAQEKALRNEIEKYLDKGNKLNAFYGLTALQIKTLIQRHIKNQGDEFAWAREPVVMSAIEILAINRYYLLRALMGMLLLCLIFYLVSRRHRVGRFFLISVGISLVLLMGGIFLLSRSKYKTAPVSLDDHLQRIAATQLHPVLNEMTAAGPLKKGIFRKWFYASALRVIAFIKIPLSVPTVSTIRWLVIDKKRRMLFLSNFCNTTDFYVRDFLNDRGTAWAVNFMFSNGRGFPDGGPLYLEGIRKDPEGYMNAVHAGQRPNNLWYAHEPMLTQDIIHKYRKIREGLFKEMDEQEASEWLLLL